MFQLNLRVNQTRMSRAKANAIADISAHSVRDGNHVTNGSILSVE